MGPPFPPPLGSSLDQYPLTDQIVVALRSSCLGQVQVEQNPIWLPLSHWLLSFGAKIESSTVIGSQFWREKGFQTRARIGPWKMAKFFGGKNIFKQGPPWALGKLVFLTFSAREKSFVMCKGSYLMLLTGSSPFLSHKFYVSQYIIMLVPTSLVVLS